MKQIIATIINILVTSTIVLGIVWYYSVYQQPQNSLPTDLLSNSETIPTVIADVLPSVVSITVTADVPVYEQYYRSFPGFRGREILIPESVQVGTERVAVGGGSGFVVDSTGYIMTNNHVVSQTGVNYSVVDTDGHVFPAIVVYRNPEIDVAIVRVQNDEPMQSVQFANSDTLQLGQTAIAIGNALAEFPNSVSVGVVSGLARNISATDELSQRSQILDGLIQTDAAINPGNSGGPLLDINGNVIGMNVAVADGTENIGFAIPANTIRNILDELLVNNQ